MSDKQLNVWIRSDLREAIKEVAEREGRTMTALVEEFLAQGIARQRGEVIEQQSLPVVREAIHSEIGQANAQLYHALRDLLHTKLLEDLKAVEKKGDDRLAALLVRAIREGGIARRMIYPLLVRLVSESFSRRPTRMPSRKRARI
jgi:antitoxin component of RelBE/YafQ-DinJ toxin-antitoxin module